MTDTADNAMATVEESLPISHHTKEKVAKAKFTLEHFYNNLVSEHEDREKRYGTLHFTVHYMQIC